MAVLATILIVLFLALAFVVWSGFAYLRHIS